MSLLKEIGSALRKARGERSLRDVAERIKVGHTHLSEIERGQRNVSIGVLERIAKELKVRLHVTLEPTSKGDPRSTRDPSSSE